MKNRITIYDNGGVTGSHIAYGSNGTVQTFSGGSITGTPPTWVTKAHRHLHNNVYGQLLFNLPFMLEANVPYIIRIAAYKNTAASAYTLVPTVQIIDPSKTLGSSAAIIKGWIAGTDAQWPDDTNWHEWVYDFTSTYQRQIILRLTAQHATAIEWWQVQVIPLTLVTVGGHLARRS